jgi:hypothetical protein
VKSGFTAKLVLVSDIDRESVTQKGKFCREVKQAIEYSSYKH